MKQVHLCPNPKKRMRSSNAPILQLIVARKIIPCLDFVIQSLAGTYGIAYLTVTQQCVIAQQFAQPQGIIDEVLYGFDHVWWR